MALKTPAFNDAKSYGFEWLRALLETHLQEGVFAAGDCKVTAAAAGGMRVDVAAGMAAIKGDSGVPGTGLSQGLYLVVNDAAIANALTFSASHATLPRLDQVVLRVRDSSDLGSGADDAVLEIVEGVATAGATLDNRTGAAALPNDRLRLADVLIPAASVAVAAGNVRDRRPWARGAYRRIIRNAIYSTASSTRADIDAVNLKPRIECSGVPVRVTFRAPTYHSVASALYDIALAMDGAPLDGSTNADAWGGVAAPPASNIDWIERARDTQPAAGSHLFHPQFSTITAGTLNINGATAARATEFIVEEIVLQNADNT